jgi:hypothetical protein
VRSGRGHLEDGVKSLWMLLKVLGIIYYPATFLVLSSSFRTHIHLQVPSSWVKPFEILSDLASGACKEQYRIDHKRAFFKWLLKGRQVVCERMQEHLS